MRQVTSNQRVDLGRLQDSLTSYVAIAVRNVGMKERTADMLTKCAVTVLFGTHS